jgi:hypothetical protein
MCKHEKVNLLIGPRASKRVPLYDLPCEILQTPPNALIYKHSLCAVPNLRNLEACLPAHLCLRLSNPCSGDQLVRRCRRWIRLDQLFLATDVEFFVSLADMFIIVLLLRAISCPHLIRI